MRNVKLTTALATITLLTTACQGDTTKPAANPKPTPTTPAFSDLPPKEIFDQALSASSKAKSLHIKGTHTAENGKKSSIDLQFNENSSRARLTLNGEKNDTIRIGKNIYTSADGKGINRTKLDRELSPLLKGKYFKFKLTKELEQATNLLMFTSSAVESFTQTRGNFIRTGFEKINNQDAVVIVNSTEKYYIATEGQHHFLRIMNPEDTVDLYDYNVPQSIKPPPQNKILESGL